MTFAIPENIDATYDIKVLSGWSDPTAFAYGAMDASCYTVDYDAHTITVVLPADFYDTDGAFNTNAVYAKNIGIWVSNEPVPTPTPEPTPAVNLMQVTEENAESIIAKAPWDITGPGFTSWNWSSAAGPQPEATLFTLTDDEAYVGYGEKALIVDLSNGDASKSYNLDYTANNLESGKTYTIKFRAKAVGVADLSNEWYEYTVTFVAKPSDSGTGPNTGYEFAGHCCICFNVAMTVAEGCIILDDFAIVEA